MTMPTTEHLKDEEPTKKCINAMKNMFLYGLTSGIFISIIGIELIK